MLISQESQVRNMRGEEVVVEVMEDMMDGKIAIDPRITNTTLIKQNLVVVVAVVETVMARFTANQRIVGPITWSDDASLTK